MYRFFYGLSKHWASAMAYKNLKLISESIF